MNLALANAELTSGFAVSKQNRKGFVAPVHDALLVFFHEQGCIAQQGNKTIQSLHWTIQSLH